MFYVYDKETDTYSKMMAAPFIQRKNSRFTLLTAEEFDRRVKARTNKDSAEKILFTEDTDLSSGVSEADG